MSRLRESGLKAMSVMDNEHDIGFNRDCQGGFSQSNRVYSRV